MAAGITTFQAIINGALKTLIGGQDASGNIAPAHILVDASGAAVSSGNPMPVSSRNGVSITQTTVTLPANTDTVIAAANANRRSLHVINIDTGYASLAFGTTAVVDSGLPLDAAAVTGQQGGGFTWGIDGGPPIGAVHAISLAGTRIVVLEGT